MLMDGGRVRPSLEDAEGQEGRVWLSEEDATGGGKSVAKLRGC